MEFLLPKTERHAVRKENLLLLLISSQQCSSDTE